MKPSAHPKGAGAEWCLSRKREVFLNEAQMLIFLRIACYTPAELVLAAADGARALSRAPSPPQPVPHTGPRAGLGWLRAVVLSLQCTEGPQNVQH